MALEIVRRFVNGAWKTEAAEGGGGGAQPVLTHDWSLTAAQLKGSTLTPVSIVPAAGAGKLLVPLSFPFLYTFVSVAYRDDLVDGYIGDSNLNQLFGGLTSTESLVGYFFAFGVGGGGGEENTPAAFLDQPIKLSARFGGAIATATVGTAGGGYAVGDTGTVDLGLVDATYRIASVDLAGSAVTATITNGGDGYGKGFEWTTTPGGSQPGVGSGMSVFSTTVDASGVPGDGTLKGTVVYAVFDAT